MLAADHDNNLKTCHKQELKALMLKVFINYFLLSVPDSAIILENCHWQKLLIII